MVGVSSCSMFYYLVFLTTCMFPNLCLTVSLQKRTTVSRLDYNHLISNSTMTLDTLQQHSSFDKHQMRKVTHEILTIK